MGGRLHRGGWRSLSFQVQTADGSRPAALPPRSRPSGAPVVWSALFDSACPWGGLTDTNEGWGWLLRCPWYDRADLAVWIPGGPSRSTAALARGHYVSRGAIRTAIADFLPEHTAVEGGSPAPELPFTLGMPGSPTSSHHPVRRRRAGRSRPGCEPTARHGLHPERSVHRCDVVSYP